MAPSRPASPDRILAAAALEFAERGFAGARVDRIARRAGVNKAMLYYHFKSKQTLYRTLLRRTFTAATERMQAIADTAAAPPDKVDDAIAGFAALVAEKPFLPAVMMREVAEGGAHLDRATLAALAGVPRAVGGIIADGVASGAFRDVNPLFAYFSMLAPIVFFLAAAPIWQELGALRLIAPPPDARDAFVRHLQTTVRRALAPDQAPRRRSRP